MSDVRCVMSCIGTVLSHKKHSRLKVGKAMAL